ncbi:MAG: OmpA family protein [Cyanobacteriota bacterium]|nr:OmpA family protein [Cyanobacteriota bacterium]
MALSNDRFEPTQSSSPPRGKDENSTSSKLTPDVEDQLLVLLDLLGESGSSGSKPASGSESGADSKGSEGFVSRPPSSARLSTSGGDIIDVTFSESSPTSNAAQQATHKTEQGTRDLTQTAGNGSSARQLTSVDEGRTANPERATHASTPIAQNQQQLVKPEEQRLEERKQTTNPEQTTRALTQTAQQKGIIAKDEGQRTKDEGQRTKDEGRRAKDEGQITNREDDPLLQLQGLLVGSEMAQADEKVAQLNKQLAQLENLIADPAALIELLLPVVAELLDRKVTLSQEEMCRALFPLIDQMIYQRAQQDREAVSTALADVIPSAIAKELQNHPDEIVNAIAPAMGAAIKEQIRLDRDSVVQALAPEMGRAIKHQIELERDVMVDALYPVIGSTIKRYIAEAIQEINQKVGSALSVEGVKRKIRAKVQGVSEAELIFQESMPAKVQAVFLIHKASGLVISQAHQSDILHLDADMIGGMLTAIRSFVNDCIAQSGSESELNQIEYGDSQILLEVAGYCYLAVVVQGDPPRPFIEKIRDTLSYLIQKYGDPIEQFEGDPESVPEAVLPVVEKLMEIEVQSSEPRRGFPRALVGAIAAVAIALFVPLGFYARQQSVNRQLERETLSALYGAPDLSVYRFSTAATRKALTLEGRVESEFLRDRAEQIARSLTPARQIDNQILVVNVPPDPARVAAEVKRIEALLAEEPGVEIEASYETLPSSGELPVRGKVTIAGRASSLQAQQRMVNAFERIPGVAVVSSAIAIQEPDINVRIYFKPNSTQLEAVDGATKIKAVIEHLEQYSEIHLKVVGYSPSSEGGNSSQVAIARATAVRTALIEQGIAPNRLEVQGVVGSPSDVRADAPDWLSQCVRFEAIAPTSSVTAP